jgi:hypothetical protein
LQKAQHQKVAQIFGGEKFGHVFALVVFVRLPTDAPCGAVEISHRHTKRASMGKVLAQLSAPKCNLIARPGCVAYARLVASPTLV